MAVILKATPCIHIIDHASRNSSLHYGVLLGKSTTEVTVFDAFDLKVVDDLIDFTFLSKKLALFNKVSPHLKMIGIYCTRSIGLPSRTFLSQFGENGYEVPLIYLEMPAVDVIECFNLRTSEKVEVTLGPGNAETVAVSTIQNHPNYTQEEQELAQENKHLLSHSLTQLQNKIENILREPSQGPDYDRKLVHLAQLLTNYKAEPTNENLQLTTSHICLIIAQLATVNSATAQVNRRITGLNKNK